MRKGYFLTDNLNGRVRIYPDSIAFEVFTNADSEYLHGYTKKRPLDLDLHIVLYILKTEGIPSDIFNEVAQWVKDNPVAGRKLPFFGMELMKID